MFSSATSNNMKLVHWPLMGGLPHLVQRGEDWAGPQPAQAPPRCTKCNSPHINGQCTNHECRHRFFFQSNIKPIMRMGVTSLREHDYDLAY